MKFSLFYYPHLGGGDPNAFSRQHLGNDPAQYAYLLEDIRVQTQVADDAGFYGVYFAEHHFQTEGFQVAHNGLLFDTWVGMHTRRLKLGQLGLVLPAWNPLRLAEDISTVAHMFPGRLELGFARGFQSREVAPLAAAHQVEGAMSDRSEADIRNRRLFMENYEILMAALTEDYFRYDGEFSKVPPKDLHWPNPVTQRLGGGVSPEGTVTDLGVVPKLPGRRLPLRWQAFSGSPETVRWAAREGMNLALVELGVETQRRVQDTFREAAAEVGRDLAHGQGIAYIRGMLCLEDGEEARRHDRAASDAYWGTWGDATGFTVSFQPGGGAEALKDRSAPMKPYSYDLVRESRYTFAGDPDEVSRDIERLQAETSCEHLILHYNTGIVPRDVLLRSLDLFGSKVLPRFDAS